MFRKCHNSRNPRVLQRYCLCSRHKTLQNQSITCILSRLTMPVLKLWSCSINSNGEAITFGRPTDPRTHFLCDRENFKRLFSKSQKERIYCPHQHREILSYSSQSDTVSWPETFIFLSTDAAWSVKFLQHFVICWRFHHLPLLATASYCFTVTSP